MIQLAELAPILEELGVAKAVGFEPLSGGSGATFRLELADGTSLILKDFSDQKTSPAHDAHVARLLWDQNVTATRYLMVDESRSRLPFPFAITTYVAGRTVIDFEGHADYGTLFEQIGSLARNLHSISLPGFGTFPRLEYRHNAEYVGELFDYSLERFTHFGADVALANKLRDLFERDFEAIVPVRQQAVFAHDDLHPGNVLAVETGGGLVLSGLIDFGNARASASVMDLAKTLFICEHMAPGSRDAILRGYGAIDHPAPDAALAFYTMLHRIIMWWWLRRIGVIATADAKSELIEALQSAVEQG